MEGNGHLYSNLRQERDIISPAFMCLLKEGNVPKKRITWAEALYLAFANERNGETGSK